MCECVCVSGWLVATAVQADWDDKGSFSRGNRTEDRSCRETLKWYTYINKEQKAARNEVDGGWMLLEESSVWCLWLCTLMVSWFPPWLATSCSCSLLSLALSLSLYWQNHIPYPSWFLASPLYSQLAPVHSLRLQGGIGIHSISLTHTHIHRTANWLMKWMKPTPARRVNLARVNMATGGWWCRSVDNMVLRMSRMLSAAGAPSLQQMLRCRILNALALLALTCDYWRWTDETHTHTHTHRYLMTYHGSAVSVHSSVRSL